MSIKSAYVCDHCNRAFKIERKSEYIKHLKVHAEKRLKKHFKRKYSAIIDEKRDRFFSSKSVDEIISVISEMNMTEIGHFNGDYRYLEDTPRHGEFSSIYFMKILGDISFRCFEYENDYVNVVFNIDPVNFNLLRSFVSHRSFNLDFDEKSKFICRYYTYKCPDFIKTLHKRHLAITKLKV